MAAAALLATGAGVAEIAPPASAGREAFQALGCGGCHAVTRPAPGMTLAARLGRKGPDLWFAGSKLRAEWLAGWLAAPEPIRGIRYDTLAPDTGLSPHPAAPADEVSDVVAYLMSLTDPDMPVGGVPQGPMSTMDRVQGRIYFGREQQCFACHRVETRAGAAVGGVSGPSLADAGRRLNPDWVLAYLTDPTRYEPVPRMPIYSGKTFAGYGPEQMAVLARYVAEIGR